MKNNQPLPVKKNEIIDITIDDFAVDGSGIGHFDGLTIFVPLSVPGDRLSVKIVKAAKRHAYGIIDRIISPAEGRKEPDCPVYSKCGGCCFRHISYETELKYKEKRVRDSLFRIGGIEDIVFNEIVGNGQRDRYRNKCLLPIGRGNGLEMGFYAPHSHRIIDTADCLLQPTEFSLIMGTVRSFIEQHGISVYDETAHTGLLRRLFLRKAEKTGEIMVCLVVNGDALPFERELAEILTDRLPEIASIMINRNSDKTNVALGKESRCIYGREYITDVLCGLKFAVSPLSFYQVNRKQAERLYMEADRFAELSGTECLVDLYCGTGTIGLSLAAKAGRLIGVEIVPDAVENARENARRNCIENAEFLCMDAAGAGTKFKADGIKPDVVIIDPPRKGCSNEALDLIAELDPQRIIYISCDPATLARDLKYLAVKGYRAVEATPFDLFPATAHVETCVLISRKS